MQSQDVSHTGPAALSPSHAEEHAHWPELLRDVPRLADPFPWRIISPWLGGSAVLLVFLLTMLGYLLWSAGHQILFLNSAGQLIAMRADGYRAHPLTFAAVNNDQFGPPQWAHNGRLFATLTAHNNVDYVVIAQPNSEDPVLIRDSEGRLQVLPTGAWSTDDTRLAVTGTPNAHGTPLFLVNPVQPKIMIADASLVQQTPIAWHPREDRLLVTSPTGSITPTLRIVEPDGKSAEFAPQDQQVSRSFGAWSPDGSRIAYVATTTSGNMSLRGGIWIANTDGSKPQQLIKDGLNLKPIWSPTGETIFFTRWLTQTNSYDLYRVAVDGSNVTRIGIGTPVAGTGELLPLEWSPDQTKLIFQSFDYTTGTVTIWVANNDGSNSQPVLSKPAGQQYVPVHWAPTGRALLLVTPENNIVLHWVDEPRSETLLAVGNAPDWQP